MVGTGAISWLYYANRLQQLPLGVVGAAISVAVLPILSHHLKAGETDEACHIQNKAIEYGALLSIPAAVALIVLAGPIINILFQHGKFGTFETAMTTSAVIAYAVGLPVYVMVKALAPNFFARRRYPYAGKIQRRRFADKPVVCSSADEAVWPCRHRCRNHYRRFCFFRSVLPRTPQTRILGISPFSDDKNLQNLYLLPIYGRNAGIGRVSAKLPLRQLAEPFSVAKAANFWTFVHFGCCKFCNNR